MDLISVFNKLLGKIVEDLQGEIVLATLDPSQRFFWGTLLSSLIIAWLLLSFEYGFKKSFNQLRKDLFSKEILLHKSSKLDFKLFIFNLFFKSLITLPFVGLTFYFSTILLKIFRFISPTFEGLQYLSPIFTSILYTLLFFLISDFFRFFHHYLMHKLKWLRAIHRTHHTATVLTPLTLLRTHPLEISLAQIRNSISYSLSLSLSVYLFPGPVTAWDILGVNVFGFLFNFLGSNLRHAAIDLSFGKLEYIFISPRMHQLHHSDDPKYFNKNFGVSLSIWDLMFGSFYKPTKEEMKSIRFGFPFKEKNEEVDLRVAIIAPLKKIFNP